MSAWIVSKKHIDLMVAGIVEGTRDGAVKPRRKNKDRLGQMLVDECVTSVKYRYPDGVKKYPDGEKVDLPGPNDPYYLKPYKYEDPKYRPTAAELAKALSCYRYQSCEHPEWETSAAHDLTALIGDVIAAAVPAAKRMREAQDDAVWSRNEGVVWPEYENAAWGFEWTDIALAYAAAHQEHGRPLLRAILADPKDETIRKALIDFLMGDGLIPESVSVAELEEQHWPPLRDWEYAQVKAMVA